MNPIEMHALPKIADFIWNSFQSSHKRHIILTGKRGSGKTTLLHSLFPNGAPGITTWAKPQESVFLCENRTKASACIGKYDDTIPGESNKMRPIVDGFLTLGVDALIRAAASDEAWSTIDEIGYLDVCCDAYCQAVLHLMEKKHVCAVVRKQELSFLKELLSRKDVFLVDLDDLFGNIGCVIMASGHSRRFGANKLMATFHGEPMILRAIAATNDIFSQRIAVTRYKDVSALCRENGLKTILHELPDRNDTVRLGLEALYDTDGCLFCPGDQPLLSWETVASIALCAKNDPDMIWRAASAEGVEGAPVFFPSTCYDALKRLPTGKGGGFLIQKYPERLRTVTVRDATELLDADTPEMLRVLEDR